MREQVVGEVVLNAMQFGWIIESEGSLKVILLDGQITSLNGFRIVEPLSEPIDFPLLKASHPLGAIWIRAYASLNKEIQELIKICRALGNPLVIKLHQAMETGNYYQLSTSSLKKVISPAQFNKIFAIACMSVAFDLEEAEIIESDYRQMSAFDLGLDLDATWQQIEITLKRKKEDDEFADKMENDQAFHDYVYRLQQEFILEIKECYSLIDLEILFRKLVTLGTNEIVVQAIRQVQDNVHPSNKVSDSEINAILIAYLKLAGDNKNQQAIDILYDMLGRKS